MIVGLKASKAIRENEILFHDVKVSSFAVVYDDFRLLDIPPKGPDKSVWSTGGRRPISWPM